ncbi:acetyl-CoA carboxylase biotin carboxyl carrier protein [Liquorilactobacillus vini]|uniref:Biotin carboxyl carrier protein of acetyl-CoA carboxylase n=1 Tax=Liquorilactobacillus vini DSM 20605 TaxID=1133569 RepID=A0A0R2C9W0_9LACO|nr:biotin/lipoyl-containing protein [Liquorilactobacillus vini]KRM84646.1 hypothetical protein FD21_GL001946 [Liquorilactobacillus vini DSM 20605]
MEIPNLNDLIKVFEEAGLTKLVIKNQAEKIVLEKQTNPVINADLSRAAPTKTAAAQANNVEIVKAPFIGTFYQAPKPQAAPFVKVGTSVTAGQQLGIIEAMKMMNEIKSPLAGKVVKILATDGAAVEYDQPLFEIQK